MAEISTVSLILLLIAGSLFGFLYINGKKKYMDYLVPLDSKEFSLRDFLPVGFAAMELIKYQYNTELDRKNRKYLKELYDPEYVEFYLRVYWAQAATFVIISLVMGALVNVAINDPLVAAMFVVVMGVLLPYVTLQELEKKVQKRHMEIALELPELVNKVLILTGAGLTLQGALNKIAQDMHSEKLLYQELSQTMKRISAGETSDVAFTELTVKCNTPEMRRFVSLIIQNIHRGGSDVAHVMQGIGEELWRSRKAMALRVAEEASTKMLFPMMLMLFAVILLVAAPALQGMSL